MAVPEGNLWTSVAAWFGACGNDLFRWASLAGGGVVAFAALKQAGTARRRHEAQTKADIQRRITESFSKAVEQLGDSKIQTRLGGIYTLERVARESVDDHCTVMETLTAFIRERRQWDPEWDRDGPPDDDLPLPKPPADIAAALAVIARRKDEGISRERREGLKLDLRYTDLQYADLAGAHLEDALLNGVHLEGADLTNVHFEGALLKGAYFEGATLTNACFEGADFTFTKLQGTDLSKAHLSGVNLTDARGDAATRLPDGIPRPTDWPSLKTALTSLDDLFS